MGAEPWILGLGGSHNGGACLLRGSELVVAVQEERLSGVKREWTWLGEAALSISYCLEAAGIEPADLDVIAVSALPSAAVARHDLAANPVLGPVVGTVPVVSVGHHMAHAASAYALSGFSDAAVLVIDGSGSTEGDLRPGELRAVQGPPGAEAISMYRAQGPRMIPVAKYMTGPDGWLGLREGGMRRFGTLGGMYSAVADQIFGDVHAAGKVMGLAPCGRPTIPVEEFLRTNGPSIQFTSGVAGRFRHDERWPHRRDEYSDLAASVQAALEAGLAAVMRDLTDRIGRVDRLCYAGGVALNVVANERVIAPVTDDLFILPAAEDSGVSVGAAYAALWQLDASTHPRPRLRRDSTGRTYLAEEARRAIESTPGVVGRRPDDVFAETCERLASGQVVGWFHDGSELGPRSLGQRTLLCDPRDPGAKERLNARVKYREPFRPFAPVLPERAVGDWFVEGPSVRSPFMLAAAAFKPERARRVPAVVHVDGTGRLQTVSGDAHPVMHRLLERWEETTGVPILLNTSFNLAGEPIVETPEDAVRCLLSSGIDWCVLGEWLAERRDDGASIVDLFPERVGERVGDRAQDGLRHYVVETPWGRTSVGLRNHEDGLAMAATGHVRGGALVRAQLPDADERTAVQTLHRLWRLRILRFHESPVGVRTARTGTPTASGRPHG